MDPTKKVKTSLDITEQNQNIEDAAIFKLNDDCMRQILSFLSIKDRIKIQSVCKNWQRLSNLPWNDIKDLQVSFTLKSDAQKIKYTVPILRQVLKRCGITLTKLKLGSWHERGFTKSIIMLIRKMCPNLTALDLTGMILTQKGAEALADNFHDLTFIGIGDCWNGCSESLSRLFSLNKRLQAVNFCNSKMIERCFSRLPVDSIESLTFGDGLPIDCITKVLPNFKKLRSLSIYRYYNCSTENLDKILSVISKALLEELFIRDGNKSSSDEFTPLKNISYFSNLKSLRLHGNLIFNDEVFATIGKNCKLLTYVSLSNSPKVTNDGLKSLFEHLNLKELHMDTLKSMSEKCFAYIHMPALEIVSCTYSSQILVNEAIRLLMLGSKNLKYIKFISPEQINLPDIVQEATSYVENRTTKANLKIYLQGKDVTPETCYINKNLILELHYYSTNSDLSSYDDLVYDSEDASIYDSENEPVYDSEEDVFIPDTLDDGEIFQLF